MITKKFHGSVLYGPLGELEGGPFLSMGVHIFRTKKFRGSIFVNKNGPMELFCYHIWTPRNQIGGGPFLL